MQSILHDLRFALRMLRKSPVFAVIAVLVITLGTGAVTTIFSVANAIALRPLAGVERADELVDVMRVQRDGTGSNRASYPYFAQLRGAGGASGRARADVAAWAMMPLTISTGSEGVSAQGTIVSGNYFRVLDMRPALGRFFTPDEDAISGAPPVVVLSHAFWSSRLAADSSVIGRIVRLNGYAVTVVGIAPPGFGGVYGALRNDAWVPMSTQPQLRPGPDLLQNPAPEWLELIARIPEGASRGVVERELSQSTAEYVALGSEPADRRAFTDVRVSTLSGLPFDMHGPVLGFMALMLGGAGLVLLIASINVAAMLLARGVARQRETSVRLALGATRRRLVRQLLTETLVLYALGAVGGVALALNAAPLLAQLPLPTGLPLTLDFAPDARVLAFTLVVALATGVAFGIAPALRATGDDIGTRLRTDSSGAGTRRATMHGVLIAAQMAGSLLLLVAAGLFLRALDRGRQLELGFETSHVAVAGISVETFGYDASRRQRFFQSLKESVANAPGVVAVSYADDLPLRMHNSDNLQLEGSAVTDPGERGTPVPFAEVGDGYFDVLQIPIVEGRGFTGQDDERAPNVAVINQSFARRHWPTGAIGRTFRRGNERVTVVGVARDAKYATLREAAQPFVYFALGQRAAHVAGHAELLVRTSGDPSAMAPLIREAVLAFDPLVPTPAVTTLAATTSAVLLPQQVAALVTAVLGGVGLLLAAVGLYGIVAFSVGERTREIGVRLALGADRGDVLRMVVRQGMRPVAAGLGIGVLLAAGVTRLLVAYLLGVSPLDAVTFAAVGAILVAVALAASYLPARRAARTDPVRALRAE